MEQLLESLQRLELMFLISQKVLTKEQVEYGLSYLGYSSSSEIIQHMVSDLEEAGVLPRGEST